MIILSVETATQMGSVALLKGDHLLGERVVYNEGHHSQIILAMIDHLLKECRVTLSQIDVFAVSIGPGSFTGLRVGIATVKGLAIGLAKPVIGIPTLEAFARRLPFTPYPICPMINARKGEVYAALYQYDDSFNLNQVKPERLIALANLLEEIEGPTHLLGPLAPGSMETWPKGMIHSSPLLKYPTASTVGFVAFQKGLPKEEEEVEMIMPEYPSEKVKAHGMFL